jgi:hypothetical protein
MTDLKKRIQRLELDHRSFIMPKFLQMSDEELENLAVDLTRDILRSKLNREPKNEEVDQQRDRDKAYMASLTTQELVDLHENLRKQA